jgi:arylsulfatase A-like enzyme
VAIGEALEPIAELRQRSNRNGRESGRVPFIAVWPGKIRPGTISREPIVAHDIVATLAHFADQPIDRTKVKDSLNLIPLLTGKGTTEQHNILMHPSQNGPTYAIRKGDLKLIMQAPSKKNLTNLQPVALFTLKDNAQENEQENLLKNPEYKSRADQLFKTYLEVRKTGRPTIE